MGVSTNIRIGILTLQKQVFLYSNDIYYRISRYKKFEELSAKEGLVYVSRGSSF